MTFLYGFIAGWWACSALFCVALALWKLRRLPPPTKHRRRHALPEVTHYPPMPPCKPAREADMADVGGIRYEHLGMTGEEV
jgi:cytochrome oxidase assembly protein ShyY1